MKGQSIGSDVRIYSKSIRWDAASKKVQKTAGLQKLVVLVQLTLPKFNSSPLKSYRIPIGKDRLPTTIFQGRALKLPGEIQFSHVFF